MNHPKQLSLPPKRDDLIDLLGLTIQALKAKITDGTATAADLSAAIKLLKDNNVGLVPVKTDELGDLRNALPFQSIEDLQEDRDTFN